MEITPASVEDETTFRNLFQFYVYEFSRFMGWTTTYAGRFIESDLDGCWDREGTRNPFLIRHNGDLAGFAIVDKLAQARYLNHSAVNELAEFFIMAAFQRQGIGRLAATHLFDLFDGKWHVFCADQNQRAGIFWQRVVNDYTQGQYQTAQIADHDGTLYILESNHSTAVSRSSALKNPRS